MSERVQHLGRIKAWLACGRWPGEQTAVTMDLDRVTCRNCRRTSVWKFLRLQKLQP